MIKITPFIFKLNRNRRNVKWDLREYIYWNSKKICFSMKNFDWKSTFCSLQMVMWLKYVDYLLFSYELYSVRGGASHKIITVSISCQIHIVFSNKAEEYQSRKKIPGQTIEFWKSITLRLSIQNACVIWTCFIHKNEVRKSLNESLCVCTQQ